MKITRPGAGGRSNRMFHPAKGVNTIGSDRTHSRPGSFRLHLRSSSRQMSLPAVLFPQRPEGTSLGTISSLKCRRNPPIQVVAKRRPAAANCRKEIRAGAFYKTPPRGKDAV